MKIFISHSMRDKSFIKGLQNTLSPHGFSLLIAEHNVDLKKTITDKIEGMIRDCNCALILLTKNGYKSIFVQQEIGYLKSCDKPFLQVIEKGYEKKIKGFNFGRGYLIHDPATPQETQIKIKECLLLHWTKTYQRQQLKLQRLNAEQKRKNEEAAVFFTLLGSVLALGLSSS